jgi:hypothetical protein
VTCRRAVTHSGVSGNIRVTDILLEKRVYVREIGDSVWSLLPHEHGLNSYICSFLLVQGEPAAQRSSGDVYLFLLYVHKISAPSKRGRGRFREVFVPAST